MMCGRVRQKGFTLVELLVVAAIMGIVVLATYSLYHSNQRSNLKQDDIVEVQQNLRIAMDQIRKDILLAGFMCAQGTSIASAPRFSFNSNPTSNSNCSDASDLPGSGGDCFTIRTASTRGTGVRINLAAPFDSPSNPETEQSITVASEEMADLLRTPDSSSTAYVRIIRPGDFGQPVDSVLEVTAVSGSTVTVKGFNAPGTYRTGYMMARVTGSNPVHPSTIQYHLEDDPDSEDPALMRLVRNPSDGNRDRIATNITGLEFSYLLDNGTEVDSVAALDAENIRAIRVAMTGATDATRSAGSGGVTTRTLSSVIALRNR